MCAKYDKYDSISIDDDSGGIYVNGEEPKCHEGADSYADIVSRGHEYDLCPYCSSKFYKANFSDLRDYVEWYAHLYECVNCRFWTLQSGRCSRNWNYEKHCTSVIEKYLPELPPECSHELSRCFKQNPDFYQKIDPIRLERFVGDVFKANYKDAEVTHVGQSRDWGIDVLMIDSLDEKWAIQVKRRGKFKASEPFETVQRLAGTLLLKDIPRGVVVTTADHYTSQAIEAAKKLKKTRFHIDLVDRGKLDKLLEGSLPLRPWEEAISEAWNEDYSYQADALESFSLQLRQSNA